MTCKISATTFFKFKKTCHGQVVDFLTTSAVFFNENFISILTTCAIAFKNDPKIVRSDVKNSVFEGFPLVQG